MTLVMMLKRMDIGQCSRYHDLALRADYEAAVKKGKSYNYEMDVSLLILRQKINCSNALFFRTRQLFTQGMIVL